MHKSLQRGRELNEQVITVSDYAVKQKQDRFGLDARKDFNGQDSQSLEETT